MSASHQTFLLRWIYVYILSIGFQTLLPWRAQLPEFIFLAGLVYCALRRINIFSCRLRKLEWLLLSFFGFTAVVSLFSFSNAVMLQIVTHAYLLLLFFVVRYLCSAYGEEMVGVIKTAFIWSGVLTGLLGILGVVIYYVNGKLFLADVYFDYPYFGTVARGMAFTSSPSMFAGICGIALLILSEEIFSETKRTRRQLFVGIILVVGMLASVSKDCLLYLAGIFFLAGFYAERRSFKVVSRTVGVVLLLILLVSTHFTFSGKSHKESLYTPQGDYAIIGNVHVAETGYTYLKRVSYKLGMNHLLTGVGEGNFNSAARILREQNKFPERMADYDPHSTYFGVFVETGLFGFVFLCVVTGLLVRLLIKKHQILKKLKSPVVCVILILIFYSAIWADVLNYRHLWVILGIFSGLITYSEKHPSPVR